MKRLLVFAALLALPLAVGAQTYTVNLSPDNVVPEPGPELATGFATVTFVGTNLTYNILVSGVTDATSAHIHMGAAGEDGAVAIDLEASFVGGVAAGSLSADADATAAIVANPAGYYVQVHSTDSPAGAVRGQLGGGSDEGVTLYLPVAAAVEGAGGTFFRTDARIVNRSANEGTVVLDYFPDDPALEGATATVTVAPSEQAVLDDMVAELFGVSNGKGAVRIAADTTVTAMARIYNDQTASGAGTFGQFAMAQSMDEALQRGLVAFLSNEDPASSEGYRSNIGWFNPNTTATTVVFRAWDTAGALLGQVSRTAEPMLLTQVNVSSLWSELADYGDFYITFGSDHGLFVYGSVVDNVNGDAIYVAATTD